MIEFIIKTFFSIFFLIKNIINKLSRMNINKQNGLNKNGEYDNNKDINPFVNDLYDRLTLSQKIQIGLMSVTIAPIRAVLVGVSLLLLWPVGYLTVRGVDVGKEPIDGWRKIMLYPIARFLSRCVFFWGSFQWLTIVGKPDMNVPIMVLAPHSSFFDVMLAVYLNFVCVVGKMGADKVVLFGNLTKMCQPIIVEREKQSSRTDTVKKILDRMNSDKKWPPLSLFSEGTCTNRRALIQFKSGAFIPGLPVQPVCLRFPATMDTYSWTWQGPHPYALLWLSFCQFHSPLEFHFLPVYHPNETEKSNPELYAENVRKLMADYLNVPCSDYSFEDGRLIHKVQEFNLPWTTGLIKVQNLRNKLGYLLVY